MSLTDMILERQFEPPLDQPRFLDMVRGAGGCMGIHRVDWQGSFLELGGARSVCWLRAADCESIRQALRESEIDCRILWQGTVHDAPGLQGEDFSRANVLVERRFTEPTLLDDVQAIEDAGANCLEMRGVRFCRTLFSTDRRRMLCLYEAPDADSVRQAQREAGMPVERVWAFRPVSMEMLAD